MKYPRSTYSKLALIRRSHPLILSDFQYILNLTHSEQATIISQCFKSDQKAPKAVFARSQKLPKKQCLPLLFILRMHSNSTFEKVKIRVSWRSPAPLQNHFYNRFSTTVTPQYTDKLCNNYTSVAGAVSCLLSIWATRLFKKVKNRVTGIAAILVIMKIQRQIQDDLAVPCCRCRERRACKISTTIFAIYALKSKINI